VKFVSAKQKKKKMPLNKDENQTPKNDKTSNKLDGEKCSDTAQKQFVCFICQKSMNHKQKDHDDCFCDGCRSEGYMRLRDVWG
jgi:hypothetical protein